MILEKYEFVMYILLSEDCIIETKNLVDKLNKNIISLVELVVGNLKGGFCVL